MPPAPGGSSAMDTISAIRSYIDRIVTSIPGMKALLLDSDTKQIVAMVYSQVCMCIGMCIYIHAYTCIYVYICTYICI